MLGLMGRLLCAPLELTPVDVKTAMLNATAADFRSFVDPEVAQ
jgi:hypothetical protein